MPALFLENYTKIYYAPWCSLSTCVSIVLLVFLILLPFFAAFATEVYYEQPKVTYNNQFILHVLQNDEPYFYSSIIKLNDFADNPLSVPLVKSEVVDTNYDNVMDILKLKIAFPSDPLNIRNIKLMVFFEYGLNSRVKLLMQTLCLIDIDTPVGASYIRTDGTLNLLQKSPIGSGTIARAVYYTDIFKNSTSPFDYVSMYKEFASRNLTTSYSYTKTVMPYRSQSETELDIEITIPSYQEVRYITPVLTALKFAWIQYLSLFIPMFVVIYLIMYFIFKNRVFPCSLVSELPKKLN